MKGITTRDYFYQAFTIDRLLKATRAQLESLREKRLFLQGIDYTTDKVQTSLNHENFNALSDSYMDLEQKYIDDELRLVSLKSDIKEHIDKLENPVHKLIMTERYVNLKRWEDVAGDNHISWRTMHRSHSDALRKVGIEWHPLDMV